MNKELNKNYNKLIFLGIFLYFAIMFAKQIFNAEIIEIQEVFGATATNTSLVTLIYYVAYAIAQVALVLYIDKINLRVYLSVTLFISAILTILIGVVGNMGAGLPFLFIVFGLNGFLQAANYAGIVKIFTKYLNREKYMLAMKCISIAATVSLAGSYGLTSIFVAISRWEIPFIITGALFVLSVVIFFFGLKPTIKKIKDCGHVKNEHKTNKIKKETAITFSKKTKNAEVIFMVLVCLVALLANYIYYALNNWFSKLLYDVHGIPKHYSILFSMGVSLLTAIGCTFAISYYNKAKKGHRTTAIGFVITAILSLLLVLTYDTNVVLVATTCIVFICITQMLKTPYSSVITYEVKDVVEPGKYSLLFNSVASIAAGCSPTIMSLLFESFGWNISFISLMVVALILVVIVLLVRVFQRTMMYGYYKDKIKFNETNLL